MQIAGVMIGSSLDGMDLGIYEWNHRDMQYEKRFISAHSIELNQSIRENIYKWRSHNASLPTEQDHREFSIEVAHQLKGFFADHTIQLIVFHGPTIIHQPSKALSMQLGCGDTLAQYLGIHVLTELRDLDMRYGGQGAPLMPILDEYLYNTFDYCINLGGIANLSTKRDGQRIGYDICPCNQILNASALTMGLKYDKGGAQARKGQVDEALLDQLNQWSFYQKEGPKSLSNAEIDDFFQEMIESNEYSAEQLLATFSKHIAERICAEIQDANLTILLSGGGAMNTFLVENLREIRPDCSWTVPNHDIIHFKECELMSFMGYLYYLNSFNILASVTGASRNSRSGKFHAYV